jgi:hypothetical protein
MKEAALAGSLLRIRMSDPAMTTGPVAIVVATAFVLADESQPRTACQLSS